MNDQAQQVDDFAGIAKPAPARRASGGDDFAGIAKPAPKKQADAAKPAEAKPAEAKPAAVPEESTGRKWVRRGLGLLPSAGGIVGGIIGGGAGLFGGGPIGIAAGGTLGAAAGGGLGKVVEDELDEVLLGDKPKTAMQGAKDIGKEAALQGVYELGGRAMAKPIEMTANYFRPALQEAARTGIRMLPSEVRGNLPSYVEKFLQGSVFTSKAMENFRTQQSAESLKAAEDLAGKMANFTGSKEDLGKLVQKGIEEHKEKFRAAQNAMYGGLDKTAASRNVMADLTPRKKFAQEELDKLVKEEKVGGKTQLQAVRSYLEDIIANPDNVTDFATIRRVRANDLAVMRDESVPLAGRRAGLAKKLASLADDAMEDAAKKSNIPGFLADVRKANAFTRAEHERFEQKLLKDVVRSKKPEAIASLISNKNAGLQETRDLFAMLKSSSNPNLIGQVQRQIVTNAAELAIKPGKGFSEKIFADEMRKLGERGRVAFGPAHWTTIQDLSRTMDKLNRGSGMGSSASLHNVTAIKNLIGIVGLAGLPLGAAQSGHKKTAAVAAAGEAAGLYFVATAFTNPAKALRMLGYMRAAEKAMRVGVPAAVSLAQSAAAERKWQAEAKLRGVRLDQQIAEPDTTPPAEESTPATNTVSALQAQAAANDPRTKQYQRKAIGPDNHLIGTNDNGVTWFDVQTGQQLGAR